MKLAKSEVKMTTTRTGTITAGDIRKKFRIPAEARLTANGEDIDDDAVLITVTHVVEASK